ncbi:Ca(2+)-dependent cysteine protease, partial [Podila epicladia]
EFDYDGEEDDGKDENICPVDYQEAGTINDDLLHELLVASLPAGCRLTVVLDCCHSGSALDLPYTYSSTGAMNSDEIFNDMSSGVNETRAALLRGDVEAVLRNLDLMDRRLENKDNREYALQIKSSEADCIMLSGCKDSQTSADAYEEGFGRTGALSWSLITTLTQNPKQSYLDLLNNVRDLLKVKYSQKPQLSSSHPVDLNRRFTM